MKRYYITMIGNNLHMTIDKDGVWVKASEADAELNRRDDEIAALKSQNEKMFAALNGIADINISDDEAYEIAVDCIETIESMRNVPTVTGESND